MIPIKKNNRWILYDTMMITKIITKSIIIIINNNIVDSLSSTINTIYHSTSIQTAKTAL